MRQVSPTGKSAGPYLLLSRGPELGEEGSQTGGGSDGVYSGDPMTDPSATFFPRIGYMDILSRGLKVMDSTAISLCMDNHLPLIVFNVGVRGNLVRLVNGETIGTRVGD